MKKNTKPPTWYGELRAAKGRIIVIKDDCFPQANKGRIYLYNTDRDNLIEYDEAIVTPKLFPLSNQEKKQAELQFEGKWQAAKARLKDKDNTDPNGPEIETLVETAHNAEEIPEEDIDDI